MRRPQAALAFVLWITCLAWIGGCASPGGPAPAAKGSPLPPHEAVITEIASTLTADAHVVTIQASSPLKYTAFRLSDPLRLVIDFVDAAFAPTVQDITLQQGAIHAIHPRFLRRERIARVEIDLRQDTPHKITQQAGKVTVTFSPLTMARAPSPRVPPRQPLPPVSPAAPPVKPTEEPKPEKPVQEVRPAEQPAPPLPHPPVPEPGPSPEAAPVQEPGLVAGTSPQVPVPPAPPPSTLSLGTFPPPAERKARTLEGLRVKKEPELTRVRLFADGKIGAYNVIKQDQPPQVLLSLPQMVNRLAAQEVPVQSPFLERIVIKEEEEPLLVFVLPPTAGYKVYREQNQLVLHFYTAPSPVSAPPLAEQVTPPPSPPAPSPVAPQKAAPPPPESTAEEAVTYTIQDITWQKLSGRSVIRVRTSTPSPRYEVVLREDPLRLVLDVRDAILPRAQHRIIDVDLEKGSAVQSIIPFQYREEPSPITRIVVRLVTRTPYRVLREEETIRLEIADPPSLPAPLHPAEKEKEEQEEAPAEQPQKRYTGTRISLDFQRADINDILRLIAEVSGLNIITGGDVKGEVSIRMVNVPWDQALDVILKTYGLGQERIGNVIRVAPRERLVREQQEVLRIKQAEKLAEELVTKVIPIKYADAGELQENLKPLLSERGIINVDRRTNTLIVKDVEANLQQVLSLVETLDQQTPQVLIEARIVETSRSFERQFGIQWGGLLSSRTDFRFPRTIGITGGRGSVSTGIANPPPGPPAAEAPTTEDERGTFVVNLPAAVGPGSGAALGITLGHINNSALLDIQLSALENTGQGRVISSPRIVTLDNKEAKIDSGFTIPFATTSAEGTRTEFVDANINLTVTPHVTPDDFVIMQIRAARNEPDFARTAAGVAPTIVRREATTNVLVKDGETTVIGGLFRRNLTNDVNGVPYLSKIPILGWLFKNERRQDNNDELLIFITPRILRKRGGEQGPL